MNPHHPIEILLSLIYYKTSKSKNNSMSVICTVSISIDFSSVSMSCDVFVTKQKRMNIVQITERCFILAIEFGYG